MAGGGHWQRSGEELLRALVVSEERVRREYAASLELIAELDTRNVAAELGYSSLIELLRDVLRIGPPEGRRRVGHAEAVTEVRLVSGGTVPAPLPVTAAALSEGVLGADHVEVITNAVRGLPAHVSDIDREAAERTLVAEAQRFDARTLARIGSRIHAVLDQDGSPPDDRELAEPVNELHLTTRRNGRLAIRGEFDPEASALITTVISPLALDALRVGMANATPLVSPAQQHPGGGCLGSASALHRDRRVRDAILDGVGPIDAGSARRIACDASVIPVVLGSRSEPLDLGRASYTVPTALRRALILRDGGCAFPGCDRSHRWCHSHHIRHWADDGPTELNNLVLLCGRHHRLIHHSTWECAIACGRAEFRPPGFVDSARTLRHNLLHLGP